MKCWLIFSGNPRKSWDEFAKPGAPATDFVFTLCASAAREVCPFWPGQPMMAHWGIEDPGNAGEDQEKLARAFREAFVILDRRIGLFLSLPLASLDRLIIQKEIEKISRE